MGSLSAAVIIFSIARAITVHPLRITGNEAQKNLSRSKEVKREALI